MFAKLLQSLDDHEVAFRILVLELVGVELKSEPLQQAQDALGGSCVAQMALIADLVARDSIEPASNSSSRATKRGSAARSAGVKNAVTAERASRVFMEPLISRASPEPLTL